MEDEFVGVVALFALPVLGWIVHIIADALVRIVCHWRDVTLKIRAIEAGMSASEIEQLVKTGRKRKNSEKKPPVAEKPAKPGLAS